MLRCMARKYKQKWCQRASIDRADRDKPRKMPLTGTERAKAFRHHRRAERESAYQPSTSNATAAADSLMELHVAIRSADTDTDVDEPIGPAGVQLRARELGLRHVNYGNRNRPPVTHTSVVCF
jgi:hypothetical protein